MAKARHTVTAAGARAAPIRGATAQTVTLSGKQWVILDQSEYEQLRAAAAHREQDLPPLPKPDAAGNVPALEYSRASLARKIILARKARGWTQKQLADAAGLRTETINRIEKGHHTPDIATVDKIQKALDRAAKA